MNKIFASYSNTDIEKVKPIKNELQELEFIAWTDFHDIKPGDEWIETISQAILESDTFLVFISSSSIKSDFVLQELNLAVANRKKVIPVVIEKVTLPPQFEVQLSGIQFIDVSRSGWMSQLISIFRNEDSTEISRLKNRYNEVDDNGEKTISKYYSMGSRGRETEEKAVTYLRERLAQKRYGIFSNVRISDELGRISEYDLIVVADGVIFSLEIKTYERSPQRETSTSLAHYLETAINKERAKAALLAKRLRNYSEKLTGIFVVPLIVITNSRDKKNFSSIEDNVIYLDKAPNIISKPNVHRIDITDVSEFVDLVTEALFGVSDLQLSVAGKRVTEENLTPNYMENVLVPYIKAMQGLQQVISELRGLRVSEIKIKAITKRSPVSLSLDDAANAVQVVQDNVVPWRRKHTEKMAALAEQREQMEIESKRAEVLEIRARAQREKAEVEKCLAEAQKQRAESNKILVETQEKQFALDKSRIELALEILDKYGYQMSEEQRIAYVQRLLPPLTTLTESELSPANEVSE